MYYGVKGSSQSRTLVYYSVIHDANCVLWCKGSVLAAYTSVDRRTDALNVYYGVIHDGIHVSAGSQLVVRLPTSGSPFNS